MENVVVVLGVAISSQRRPSRVAGALRAARVAIGTVRRTMEGEATRDAAPIMCRDIIFALATPQGALSSSQGFLGPLAFFGAGLGSNSGYVTTCQRRHHEPGLKRGRPRAGFRSGSRGVEPPASVQQIPVGGRERQLERVAPFCWDNFSSPQRKGLAKRRGGASRWASMYRPGRGGGAEAAAEDAVEKQNEKMMGGLQSKIQNLKHVRVPIPRKGLT
jgi:hypothetical protein